MTTEVFPFDTWLLMHGLEWPTLGVNRPAGASWAVAGELGDLGRRWMRDMEELNGRSLSRHELDEAVRKLLKGRA